MLVSVLFGDLYRATLQSCDTVMTVAIDILAEGP